MALPKKVVYIPRVTRPGDNPTCVGCNNLLDSFARMGSVIEGLRWHTIEGVEETPDGDVIETIKRVQYWKRKRGLVCSSCQADYRSVEVKQRIGKSDLFETKVVPFVKMDSSTSTKPIGSQVEGSRGKPKILNTRYTR